MPCLKLSGSNLVEVAINFSDLSSSNYDHNGGSEYGDFSVPGPSAVAPRWWASPTFSTNDASTSVTGQNLFNDNGSGPDQVFLVSIAEVNDSAGNVGHQITLARGCLC